MHYAVIAFGSTFTFVRSLSLVVYTTMKSRNNVITTKTQHNKPYLYLDNNNGGEEDPNKYDKRRRQKRREHRRLRVIVLLLAGLLLLAFGMGVLYFHTATDWRNKNTTPVSLSSARRILYDMMNIPHKKEDKHPHHKKTRSTPSSDRSPQQRLRRSNNNNNKKNEEEFSNHPAFLALSQLETAIQQNTHYYPSTSSSTSFSIFHNLDLLLVRLEKGKGRNPLLTQVQPKSNSPKFSMHGQFFRVSRQLSKRMAWQDEWDRLVGDGDAPPPLIDYTQDHLYDYPPKQLEPPSSGYPPLTPLLELFQAWPQDDIDRTHVSSPLSKHKIRETLQQFDFTNTTELDAALLYRNRKLPFKLSNVPELLAANQKWTDDYVSNGFGNRNQNHNHNHNNGNDNQDPQAQPHSTTTTMTTTVQGKCQESAHSFFAFFSPPGWNVETMGLPPTRNNDYTFDEWAQHARYADATRLDADRPHFYWQAGVPKEERETTTSSAHQHSFVSRDLPSFSSPNATFISFSPLDQKGIQCRFGERGVTAATHFDAGQNMVGMITGAKRYILHPPMECSKLGIVTSSNSALFRHSLLNFGRCSKLLQEEEEEEEKEMNSEKDKRREPPLSALERAWLERAATSQAVETVLKAGEILFIPSHWFHYIIGLQKNAQCNVRSGVDLEGTEQFGGAHHVSEERCDPLLKMT